ncbi:MAG: hypothetical protein KatS3mg095_0827 [Candidatus Parcubacteria bacterium]|nr:MAG: hypothetical protein KatS3mg095_0827 [Candidatus Parcubacteria bacterium]
MLAGSHLIFANAIFSNLTQNNLSAFILGIISHHLADRLPHLDLNLIKHTKYNNINFFKLPLKIQLLIYFEFLIGIFFVYYYFIEVYKINNFIIFYLSLGSILPDILNIFLKNKLEKINLFNYYFRFHKNFHFRLSDNTNKFKVLLIQIIILIISLVFFRLSLTN